MPQQHVCAACSQPHEEATKNNSSPGAQQHSYFLIDNDEPLHFDCRDCLMVCTGCASTG